MSKIHYHDLDLLIERVEPTSTTYRTRITTSPAGQANGEFTLPFSEQDLEILFLRLGRPRHRNVRKGKDSPAMNAARNFGDRLFKAVFQDDVRDCLRSSLNATTQQPDQGQGLRLRLNLTAAPDLLDLPWEYLYDATHERFLSHSLNTPIVRCLDLAQRIAPLQVQLPLNLLVMIASPRDEAPLDVEGEWGKVQSALAGLEAEGLVRVTRLPKATLAELQRHLRKDRYHIFHFIGHGGFDQSTQDGVLALEDEKGLSRTVSGNLLGTLLHDHPSLRLALLNACEGARSDRSDPFGGVAQQLLRQGIPAVIAMQFEISDGAAITLAQEFYASLADGYPVDAALAEGRKAIFVNGNDVEWGTPVLYMRASDGHLFNPTVPPAQTQASVPSVSPPVQTPAPPKIEPAKPTPPPEKKLDLTPLRQRFGLEFVPVPAGEFTMGSTDYDDERPPHKVNVDAFWIGLTPVTNAQYRHFVKADGYNKQEYWTKAGWQWRTSNKITQPGYWDDKKWNQDNFPVVGVGWYESMAYAAWVAKETGLPVRLPTEAEWEKAARGTDGRTYPWGDDKPTDQLANYGSKIGHTTAVGSYPKGASPYGALDMAGNVWEWNSTLYKEYPYNKTDGRENGEAEGGRLVRGGAWGDDPYDVRGALRGRSAPGTRYDFFGFRVVLASPGS